MKSWLWQGVLAVAIALPALSSVAQAQSDEGCSDATLKGEYAFGITAYTPPGLPNGPPRVVAGIKFFDGKGTFTQRDYRGDSLRTSGLTEFSTGETGTYTVNSDCTGSMVVNQNMFGVPPVTTQGGLINIKFVISNDGRHIHEVVAEFTPSGATQPVPSQTSADDWKVASDQD